LFAEVPRSTVIRKSALLGGSLESSVRWRLPTFARVVVKIVANHPRGRRRTFTSERPSLCCSAPCKDVHAKTVCPPRGSWWSWRLAHEPAHPILERLVPSAGRSLPSASVRTRVESHISGLSVPHSFTGGLLSGLDGQSEISELPEELYFPSEESGNTLLADRASVPAGRRTKNEEWDQQC
jgi:hypothetical protein